MASNQTTNTNSLLLFVSSLSTDADTNNILKQTYQSMFYEPMEQTPQISSNPKQPTPRGYTEVPPIPISRIANKARIYTNDVMNISNKMTIPPQNINDVLKPPGNRFKYFEKPTIPTNRGDYNEIIKEFILHDTNYADKTFDNAVLTNIEEKLASTGLDIIPPEIYKYNWHTFNKQFIINRCRNSGTYVSGASTIIDPCVLQSLKLLYPNVNEYTLRQDYAKLVLKHNLVNSEGLFIEKEDQTAIDLLINENPLIARLASLLPRSTTITELNETIKHAIETVPNQYIISKFPCINRHIISRDMLICKLAFLSGSTNATIIHDISLVRQYIKLLMSQISSN